jgi:hypothetical protein
MKVIKSIFVLLITLSSAGLKAQTADELVNKHIDAIGGRDVITKIKNLVIESDVTVMGQSLTSKTTIVADKGFKSVTSFNGVDIIQCVTPGGGWGVNPMMGSTTPDTLNPDQRKAISSAYEIGGPLYNYKEKGNSVELAGREMVNGVNAYKLNVKKKNGIEITYYLDPNTYYLIKQEAKMTMGGQEVTSTSSFSDFKKTDMGMVMPFTTTTANQGFEFTINHTKVEFNKDIDPKFFDMPKS